MITGAMSLHHPILYGRVDLYLRGVTVANFLSASESEERKVYWDIRHELKVIRTFKHIENKTMNS